ncbi:hypothetical protein FPHYL_13373 [Fusarium phyllophilum]|uniref:Uncharacterized protein n=1 Tax=Fusarium phyllophilum TaxID=47803 RepID=A0A8H5MNK7_9HYPO|nr:hypothetical protein FPHYL_13373 [Fusarium phyllophilum]
MPPSRTNKNNDQDRRDRRPDPLSRPPERTGARDESIQRHVGEVGSASRISQPTRGLSSTPRGGRSGHRGRGGYSHVGGRGGFQSNRPSSSMHWNQPEPEPETSYELSATAWMTRVCSADGVVATKLTPSGLGGGFVNNWYTGTADKGLWIQSEKLKGLEKMVQRVVDDNPHAEGFQVTITPVPAGKFASIEKRHTQKVVMNNNFIGHDGKPVGLFGTGIQAPNETKPVVVGECDLCGGKKHLLTDCVMRAYKGYVSGCPLCNNCKHGVESCDKFKVMSLQEKVQVLIQKRANRPPLRTSKPWHTYLHEFCTRREFIPGVIAGFPWSEQFCKDMGPKGMKKIQAEFDANPEGYAFDLVDEKTASFEKVFETYWRPVGLAWPAVLGPRIKSEGADGRVIKTEPEA